MFVVLVVDQRLLTGSCFVWSSKRVFSIFMTVLPGVNPLTHPNIGPSRQILQRGLDISSLIRASLIGLTYGAIRLRLVIDILRVPPPVQYSSESVQTMRRLRGFSTGLTL